MFLVMNWEMCFALTEREFLSRWLDDRNSVHKNQPINVHWISARQKKNEYIKMGNFFFRLIIVNQIKSQQCRYRLHEISIWNGTKLVIDPETSNGEFREIAYNQHCTVFVWANVDMHTHTHTEGTTICQKLSDFDSIDCRHSKQANEWVNLYLQIDKMECGRIFD